VKRGSEKCQNKHSVAIAGIDLFHIYIYIYVPIECSAQEMAGKGQYSVDTDRLQLHVGERTGSVPTNCGGCSHDMDEIRKRKSQRRPGTTVGRMFSSSLASRGCATQQHRATAAA
jgi:hypothetical protein